MITRQTARAELLILAAVMLAGATAGVLVQAGAELTRNRRGTRQQLQAAGELIEQRDERLQTVLDVNDRQADAIEQLRSSTDTLASQRDEWRSEAIARDREKGKLRDELRELQQRVVADCQGCEVLADSDNARRSAALAALDNEARELERPAPPERTTSPEVAAWPPAPPCDECGQAAPAHEPGCFLDTRGEN